MKENKGEEKLVFSAGGGKDWKKYRKPLLIGSGIFSGIFLFVTVMTFVSTEWAAAIISTILLLLFVAIFLLALFIDKISACAIGKRIEFYPDRVIFWREQAWAWPKMEARYEDIRGACINKANEVGDHVEARIEGGGTREVDTLCVYCKKGEYILFGIHKWGEEYSRRILDEILRRADAPENEPEEGEYGGGSRIAEEGFAELGVEEEPLPEDNPEENRFDIEAIVGCELYTKNGVRLGKIVQVLPAETDIYIVARDGKEMRLPAEEGIILDMNVERKRMTVDAERVFELLKEE